jgi:sulfane dehydrogenase subunit SoxC
MVERPRVFTVDDLKRLPLVSRICFIECIANRPDPYGETVADTHGLVACSEWTGVPLSILLREVGVRNGASWVIAEGAEAGKHTKSVPLVKALDDVLVAYGQNGEAVRPDQGFPIRLIVPGYEGVWSVKWLRRLKVVDQPYATFQEMSRFLSGNPKSQPNSYDLGPKSIVTFPSGKQRLPERGPYIVTGLAWSGGGAIRRVEVSTDGGRTYHDAEIAGPALPKALTRFYFPWRWEGEEALVQSRCTDERGQVQPSETQFRLYWNWTREELYQNPNIVISGHGNWIQPWKVNRDGMVMNGLAPLASGPTGGLHDHQ